MHIFTFYTKGAEVLVYFIVSFLLFVASLEFTFDSCAEVHRTRNFSPQASAVDASRCLHMTLPSCSHAGAGDASRCLHMTLPSCSHAGAGDASCRLIDRPSILLQRDLFYKS